MNNHGRLYSQNDHLITISGPRQRFQQVTRKITETLNNYLVLIQVVQRIYVPYSVRTIVYSQLTPNEVMYQVTDGEGMPLCLLLRLTPIIPHYWLC